MKTIVIGREPNCQIILNDEKASRKHALLRLYNSGKIEIIDLSKNGTFVNGMQIPSNKAFPITRKDIITFAHAEKLNWNLVPNPTRWIKWGLMSAAVLACLILVLLLAPLRGCEGGESINELPAGSSVPSGVVGADSIKKQKGQDTVKKKREMVFPVQENATKRHPKDKKTDIDAKKDAKAAQDEDLNVIL